MHYSHRSYFSHEDITDCMSEDTVDEMDTDPKPQLPKSVSSLKVAVGEWDGTHLPAGFHYDSAVGNTASWTGGVIS